MKKGIYFVLFLLALTSCSENISSNNAAAFQGVKDNVFWKATATSASITSSGLINVEGNTWNETMTLTIPIPEQIVVQKYKTSWITNILGISLTKKASFTKLENGMNYLFETGVAADSNPGDGEIVITDYDGATVSGTFRCNAKNASALPGENNTVNFQTGVFYKVPVSR